LIQVPPIIQGSSENIYVRVGASSILNLTIVNFQLFQYGLPINIIPYTWLNFTNPQSCTIDINSDFKVQAHYELNTNNLPLGVYQGTFYLYINGSATSTNRECTIEIVPLVQNVATYDPTLTISPYKDNVRQWLNDTNITSAVWSDQEILTALNNSDNPNDSHYAAYVLLSGAWSTSTRVAMIYKTGIFGRDYSKIPVELNKAAQSHLDLSNMVSLPIVTSAKEIQAMDWPFRFTHHPYDPLFPIPERQWYDDW